MRRGAARQEWQHPDLPGLRRKQALKTIHHILLAGAVGGAVFALPALTRHGDAAQASAAASVSKPADMSEGEVRKVDLAGKKITLKHGPLKNIGMPGMTMSFAVSDPAMLNGVKVGETVRFVASEQGGKLRIVHIEPAK